MIFVISHPEVRYSLILSQEINMFRNTQISCKIQR